MCHIGRHRNALRQKRCFDLRIWSSLRDCLLVRQSCRTSAVGHDFERRIPGDNVAESAHESTPVLESRLFSVTARLAGIRDRAFLR